MSELIRNTTFIGAYDFSHREPNYGIHNMVLQFSVKGPKGAITIAISTKWYLPDQQLSSFQMYSRYPFNPADLCRPDFTDVSYHAKEPQYEEHSVCTDHCEYTDGACYCDGSSLWGNDCWREGFLHGGSDWLFARMEDEYRNRFENGPPVDLTPIPRRHPAETVQ